MSSTSLEPTLVPMTYDTFPLRSIKPNGWFRDQIRLIAQGLGGHLFHFYRFVKGSTWLGGEWEYTPLNEAAPYWYNYIVPLAYALDEENDHALFREIRSQADQFLDYTLAHQAEDGWLGPETTSKTRGLWARCLLLQGLINHAVADPSKFEVILEAIYRFVRLAHSMLQDGYAGYLPRAGDVFDLQLFGVARAHELALSLQWLYEHTDDMDDRRLIWEVMDMMWDGARVGERDWTKFFGERFTSKPSIRYQSSNFQHGVNVAQGLRYPAHLYRMKPTTELAQLCKAAVDQAFAYHGTPAGSISSDEYIGGLSPQRGSELCCSVELMFSLSYLYQLFGDQSFADRVEAAAFNAVPAGVSADWWSHQYVTQVNQPWACEFEVKDGEKTPFYDVCRYANVFGLEPEFPCCTVNHPTAFPKLLMQSFLSKRTREGALAIIHAHPIPAKLNIDGIHINCDSNYPFAPCALRYTIESNRSFEFHIRIPSWATHESVIEVDSDQVEDSDGFKNTNLLIGVTTEEGTSGSFYRVHVSSTRRLNISVTFEAEVRLEQHPNNSISVYYGPLLYAYEIDFSTRERLPRNYKDQSSNCFEVVTESSKDAEPWMRHVRDHDYLPKSRWNIAIDPSKKIKVVAKSPWLERDRKAVRDLPNPVWSSGASPVYLEATAIEVDWPVRNGTAADPQDVTALAASGSPFTARLVPYGTAKLHIAQFPVVKT